MYRIIALVFTVMSFVFIAPDSASAAVVVEAHNPIRSRTCCPATILVEAQASCASTGNRELVTELIRDGVVKVRWSTYGTCTIYSSKVVGCPGSGYYHVVAYLKNPLRGVILGSDSSSRRYFYC